MGMGTTANNSTTLSADLATLRGLTGNAFDRRYMQMMVRDHEQAVALFTSAAQSDDVQVRAYATQTLPVLQAHLTRARNISSKVNQQ